MEIKGRVINITAKQGVTKANEPYIVREVLVEYQGGDYPKRFVAEVFSTEAKNKWKELDIDQNKVYNFGVDIDAREYNGRWFNSLRIWKAQPVEEEGEGTAGATIMSNAVQMMQQKFNAVPTAQPAPAQQTFQEPAEKLPF